MTKLEQKAYYSLQKSKGQLEALASQIRCSAMTKEQLIETKRISALLEHAERACELSMLRLERNDDTITDTDVLREKVLKYEF